jgi:hypothetical protein
MSRRASNDHVKRTRVGRHGLVWSLCLIALVALAGATEEECGLDSAFAAAPTGASGVEPVSFALSFRDEVCPYGLIAMPVLPGETVTFEVTLTEEGATYLAHAEGGDLTSLAPRRWRWTAPAVTGLTCLEFRQANSSKVIVVNAFVTVPYRGEAELNGYRIGSYAALPLEKSPKYNRPTGFIEVTAENRETWVSPHFQLFQFVSKQESGYPRYVVIDPRLLLKLERLLEEVRRAGIPAQTFHVMSAYRTPWYNASIGNKTSFSRHAYGDAADIFIDADGDGTMDDLDGDGKITIADAQVLANIIDGLYGQAWFMPFVGGLGVYGPRAGVRGPFVHVDTRGHRARW